MASLENLRLRALALRSSIHNEHQLSAIELCGMVAKKTNEIIEVIDEIFTILDNMETVTGVKVVYNEATEGLQIGG
jgi:hypothetical protein